LRFRGHEKEPIMPILSFQALKQAILSVQKLLILVFSGKGTKSSHSHFEKHGENHEINAEYFSSSHTVVARFFPGS
jgi:hypothetical protein